MSNHETPPAAPAEPPAPTDPPTDPPTEPEPSRHLPVAYAPAPPRRGGRMLLAGLALVVALLAGAAGFAIGHATADGYDRPGRVFREGPDGRGPFGGPGRGEEQPPGAPGR